MLSKLGRGTGIKKRTMTRTMAECNTKIGSRNRYVEANDKDKDNMYLLSRTKTMTRTMTRTMSEFTTKIGLRNSY